MPSKVQEKDYPLEFGQGLIVDLSKLNMGEGQWFKLQNVLYRNGEFKVRNCMEELWSMSGESFTPTKIFAYSTDRDENGDFNTARWIVANGSDGKIYRKKIGGSAWSEIKIHGSTSFDVSVEEFIVINQDLVFHTGHSNYLGYNSFVYGYRSIARAQPFESLGGWYCDFYAPEVTTSINSWIDPTSFRSAYVDEEGSVNYIYFIQGISLYKAEFNISTHEIGNIIWKVNPSGDSVWSAPYYKIVGVDNTDNEVYLFWDTAYITYLDGKSQYVCVFNSNTGEFKGEIVLGASVWDVVYRERDYDSTKYFFGVVYSGGNNTVYAFNQDGTTNWSKNITLNGSDQAVQIDVGFHEDPETQIYFITGFNDAGNDGEIYAFKDQDSPSWVLVNTIQASATFSSETGTVLKKGSAVMTDGEDLYFLSCFNRSGTLVQRFCSLTGGPWTLTIIKTDTGGKVHSMISPGYFVTDDSVLTPYDALPNPSIEWFNESGTSIHDYNTDIAIDVAEGGVGSITGEFKYRFVLVFDETNYSPLSDFTASISITSKDKVTVKLYMRSATELRRVTHIQLYRSVKDSDLNVWGEYKLLQDIDLRTTAKEITSDSKDWDSNDSGVTYFVTFEDTNQTLVDSYYDITDLAEEDVNFNVQFKTCFYSNGRMFFGNLRDHGNYHNDRVGFSPLGAPSINPSTNYITLSKGDPDSITAISYYNDTLLVGKRNSFYAYDISSYMPQEWYELLVRNNVGILSNEHIAITPYGAVFMDSHSVYIFDKERGIQDIGIGRIRSIIQGYASQDARVIYVPKEDVVWLYLLSGSIIYVYDLINRGWFTEQYKGDGGSTRILESMSINKENNTAYIHTKGLMGSPSPAILKIYERTASASVVPVELESGLLGVGKKILRLREMWAESTLTGQQLELDTNTNNTIGSGEYLAMSGNQQGEYVNFRVYSNDANPGENIQSVFIRYIPSRLRRR